MDSTWIVVAGTLGGTALGFGGSVLVSSLERRRDRAEALRRAYADYLGAVLIAVGDLRQLPSVQPPSLVARASNALQGEAAAWVRTRQGMQRTFGDRVHSLSDRVLLATATLTTFRIPDDMQEVMRDANDYLSRLGQQRSDDLLAEWIPLRDRLYAIATRIGA